MRKLTKKQREEIAQKLRDGEPMQRIAAEYNTSPLSVKKVAALFKIDLPDRRRKPQPVNGRYREEFKELGPPPEDPLAAVDWVGRMNRLAIYQIATSPDFDDDNKGRWALINQLSKTVASTVPMSRMLQAERLVRGDIEALEKDGGPQEENAAEFAGRRYRTSPVRKH